MDILSVILKVVLFCHCAVSVVKKLLRRYFSTFKGDSKTMMGLLFLPIEVCFGITWDPLKLIDHIQNHLCSIETLSNQSYKNKEWDFKIFFLLWF